MLTRGWPATPGCPKPEARWVSPAGFHVAGQAAYFGVTTRLRSLFGTWITFLTVAPSRYFWIRSSASAISRT